MNPTPTPTLAEFERYAAAYAPFAWEISQEDAFQAADVKGKHSVLVSLVRFCKVVQATNANCPAFQTVVDVGPYPGTMAKVLRHFFPHDFKYWAVGLGLSAAYREAMLKLGGECFETEVDPSFPGSAEAREWPMRNADCVLLLDVVEHLVDPVFCLDAINRASRMGGILVVTTDNLTSFANTYQMLRRGESPNIHPLRSSHFYRGDWRPHFREFSKAELQFFLRHCGFDIVSHEYFERRQGDYALLPDGSGVSARNRHGGVKGRLQKVILEAAPHLRDHHIVVARKSMEYADMARSRPQPTTSKAEWLRMRAKAGL